MKQEVKIILHPFKVGLGKGKGLNGKAKSKGKLIGYMEDLTISNNQF